MRLLIIGASGGTGRQLVQQALEQGHVITAFVRNPAAISDRHERLTVVKGDVLDSPSVEPVMPGQQAVLSALGVRKLGKTTVLSQGTKNIIAAMKEHDVRRLIVESSLGVGDSKGQLGWFYGSLAAVFLRNMYADKEVQERIIRESGLEWTIVRPAVLTNGPRTSVYRHWLGWPDPPIKVKVARADVAEFMLKQLTDESYLRKTPGLSY